MKRKIGKHRLKLGGQFVGTLTPFEDALNLAAMLRVELRGRRVGAYVLTKGQNREHLCFVFGFDCKGIHNTLTDAQVETIFSQLESGLKDLPAGERLTLHLGSFSSDSARQQDLAQLTDLAPSHALKFLLTSDRARIQQLTQQGLRKPKFLRLYVTYTVQSGSEGAQDLIEKLIGRGETLWKSFTGELQNAKNQRLQTVITKAFTDGFLLWEQMLSNKMGLTVKPLGEADLWTLLWQRFNQSEPIPIPQLIVLDGHGLHEQVNSEVHSTTLLTRAGIPTAGKSWAKVNGQYVAPLTFLEKPGGWASEFAQLRYLWEVLSRENVADTEIFCQLTRANETLVKTTVQRMLKQSNLTATLAEEGNSVDVAAELKVKRSIEAQEELFEGALPIHTAVVFLIHRPNLEQLDEACRYLQSCFRRPAWVEREQDYAWKVWLQTLPIVWDALMASPFNRRQLYLTGEVPGLMPLVLTQPCDAQGFELIAEEGGSPIHLDLFTQHKNLGLFATTRAGKSVLVSGILTQALAYRFPVVALDFPKPDGSSTFTDYTQLVGGAYFDISRESNNLFELPDLRHLPGDEQKERLQDFQSFLESALLTMIVGSGVSASVMTQTIRSILVLALNAFFSDSQIQQRYLEAMAGRLGSDAWMQIPTLADFLAFCTPEQLDLQQVGGNIEAALNMIELRLRFWLSSRVGRAISAPSSFPTDAQLLVFALRNLANEEDAAVLALSAYSAALRRALEAPASIFFIDEAPILFEFDEIGALIGRLCANGAKAGIRVIISAQDPDTVHKSPASAKIFQNLTTRLIGRVQPTAVDSFERILKYPPAIVSRNASDSFFPKREGIYSQWLLDNNGIYTYCRYYPAFAQLAAVANNPDEQATRDLVLRHAPDEFTGLAEFARLLVQSIQSGEPLSVITERWFAERNPHPEVPIAPFNSLHSGGSR
ncbi:MAG: hypothetical protein AAF329_16725 [Cyanobacteria bacterium P01_A01_bin.17]